MCHTLKAFICCFLIVGLSLSTPAQTVIKLRKQGNVYILPCKVNGVQMNLFFDTGADDVSLSLKEAKYMIENGYLTDNDVVGKQSYTTASGDISEGTKIIIRKITFAGLELNDVAATIMHTENAPLLFGQSAIGKLGKIQIDPSDNTLTIFKGKGSYDFSKDEYADRDAVVVNAGNSDGVYVDDKPYASQERKDVTVSTLTKAMKLKIDRPGGANGASVAWHPVQKKYYAAMAGNVSFPMEVFNTSGQMVSPDNQETLFDIRGLWYNPNTRTLQMNGYNDFGLAEYMLDGDGMPHTTRKLGITNEQPNTQSVGAYDAKNDLLYYYDMQTMSVEPHRMSDGVVYKAIRLYLGQNGASQGMADQEEVKYNYNENAIVYTGISQAEIGLLNFREKRIELYDVHTGLLSRTLKLPNDAPVQASLNFSFSNGIYWLFDKDARIWQGYK